MRAPPRHALSSRLCLAEGQKITLNAWQAEPARKCVPRQSLGTRATQKQKKPTINKRIVGFVGLNGDGQFRGGKPAGGCTSSGGLLAGKLTGATVVRVVPKLLLPGIVGGGPKLLLGVAGKAPGDGEPPSELLGFVMMGNDGPGGGFWLELPNPVGAGGLVGAKGLVGGAPGRAGPPKGSAFVCGNGCGVLGLG